MGSLNIPKGLFETLTSKKLSVDQKIEAVKIATMPVLHGDGILEGFTEPPELTEQEAEMIISALKNGAVFDPDPKHAWTYMTCNECGKVDMSFKPDLSEFDLQENPEAALEFVKKHYQKLGWQTSFGYDVCPDCAHE